MTIFDVMDIVGSITNKAVVRFIGIAYLEIRVPARDVQLVKIAMQSQLPPGYLADYKSLGHEEQYTSCILFLNQI